MTFLLDNGLPRAAVSELHAIDIESLHVGAIGLASATDEAIISYAIEHQLVIVTLDADFHTILSLRNAHAPSVIRIRIEGLRAAQLSDVIKIIAAQFTTELSGGAFVSASRRSARCHLLPLH